MLPVLCAAAAGVVLHVDRTARVSSCLTHCDVTVIDLNCRLTAEYSAE